MNTWAGDIVAPRRARVPLVVTSILPVITLVLASQAHHPLSPTLVFVPVWLVLVLAFDVMTIGLLIEQYVAGGNPRALALTWAYAWSAVMNASVLATVPGLVTGGALLTATRDEMVWLMAARIVGGPVLVVVSLLPWPGPVDTWLRTEGSRPLRSVGTHLVLLGLATLTVWVVLGDTVRQPTISRVVDGVAVLDKGIVGAMAVLSLVLLAAGVFGVRSRRGVQGIEAWALVTLVAACCGTILTLVSAAPYDLGWYGARVVGLAAAFLVLNGLLRDVSHLQTQVRGYAHRLEEQNVQLTEAQGLRDHLVAVVSHDMRNPLTGLTGYLEMLEEDTQLTPEEIRRVYSRTRLLTRRLTLLTEDLLASATTTDLTVLPSPVELRVQLDECVAGFPDLDVIVRCPPDLEVEADPLRLQQVLGNLVRNAQKYGEEPVSIHATQRGGTTVRIGVTDAGPGVPPDFLPRLFDRYSRADPSRGRGSGLGLSVSRRLVERHGGTLHYQPATNEFVILLRTTRVLPSEVPVTRPERRRDRAPRTRVAPSSAVTVPRGAANEAYVEPPTTDADVDSPTSRRGSGPAARM